MQGNKAGVGEGVLPKRLVIFPTDFACKAGREGCSGNHEITECLAIGGKCEQMANCPDYNHVTVRTL